MISAIIVAAGKGTRMGLSTDKLFLSVSGRPLVTHTWEAFDRSERIGHIVLVVRPEMKGTFEKLALEFAFTKQFTIALGGAERQDSVLSGLEAVPAETEFVAIQDGARPCTSPKLISETLDAARLTGAAVAAQKVTDTIKESDGDLLIARNVDRSRLWAVQTPQCFRVEVIRKALAEVRSRGLIVTDDTAACEFIGQPVQLVESASPNPKATSPADLPYIELLLSKGH